MIKSRSNPAVQRARQARDNRIDTLMFIEGVRLCEEALRAGLVVREALHTEKLLHNERGKHLLTELNRICSQIAVVTEDILTFISDTKTSQGIVLLAERPKTDVTALEGKGTEDKLIVIMHQVNNPANAGAMVRVAEAAGATGVITTRNSTDLFSPKALRGAMGSSFRVPLWAGADFRNALQWCAERNILTISTSTDAPRTHLDIDWSKGCAVVVGVEGSGLQPAEAAATDMSIRIPMRPPVDSLNVAVALGVVLYEAVRQRSVV